MASIAPSPTFPSTRSDPSPHRIIFPNLNPPRWKRPSSSIFPSQSLSRSSADSTTCRCHNSGSTSGSPSPSDNSRRWDFAIQDGVRNAIKWFDGIVSAYNSNQVVQEEEVKNNKKGGDNEVKNEDGEWDWDRWRKHFTEVDEQERIVSFLKSQLTRAIFREDYEDAARLKVAIAAAASTDTVGRVMSHLNKAIKDECYVDAAFVRDYAGAGLVGWWAGLSDDSNDPHGRIIRISAEHGRYVAKSFSPRQLATSTDGTPLFEIFLTRNTKGEYKQQAVYLKQNEEPQDFLISSSNSSGLTGSLDPVNPSGDKGDLFATTVEDTEDGDSDDESDITEESIFENIPRDMIHGVNDLKVKVLNMPIPGKIDRDLISKVVEQMMEEEDEDRNTELESVDAEDDVKGENDEEQIDFEMRPKFDELEAKIQIAVKSFVSGVGDKIFGGTYGTSLKDLLRVPARLEKKGRLSFSFSIKQDDRQVSGGDAPSLLKKKAKLQGNRILDNVVLDLKESIGNGVITMEALKDFSQLLNLSLAQHSQPLSESTTFNRIEFPASPDPLNAVYVSAHGLFYSEVIHLRRKFGQWQEDGSKNEFPNLEFYEYVEALKLTGDRHVPAGQVAFRAKIGKKYQLPHKGIIPEEFGVIARYRGQGRLAEPGFENPRWVDGELVILDGKLFGGGPVVGFVYWAPEYHFLVFFIQLRLQD